MMKDKIWGLLIIVILGLIMWIGYDSKDDLLAVYLDNTRSDEIPSKRSNYIIDKIVCDNDVKASWDNINWSLSINNLSQKTKCNLYFKSKKDITITYDNNYVKNNIVYDVYDFSSFNVNSITSANTSYSISTSNGTKHYKFQSGVDETSNYDSSGFWASLKSSKLDVSKKYTLRFDAVGNKNFTAFIGSEQSNIYDSPFSISTKWQKYSRVFVPVEAGYYAFSIYGWLNGKESRVLELENIELQEGEYDNYSNVSLKEYDSLGNMPNPIRSGYTFLGWYTEALGGTRVDENTIVTENTTYYAHWQ